MVGTWSAYEEGICVEQDAKEARRCYEEGEKLGSVKCTMRLSRCKFLGIGMKQAKKQGLDLCRAALQLAYKSDEKEDYGYEAENCTVGKNYCRKWIKKRMLRHNVIKLSF